VNLRKTLREPPLWSDAPGPVGSSLVTCEVIARLNYYLSSIPTILSGITNWPACFGLTVSRKPRIIIRLADACASKCAA